MFFLIYIQLGCVKCTPASKKLSQIKALILLLRLWMGDPPDKSLQEISYLGLQKPSRDAAISVVTCKEGVLSMMSARFGEPESRMIVTWSERRWSLQYICSRARGMCPEQKWIPDPCPSAHNLTKFWYVVCKKKSSDICLYWEVIRKCEMSPWHAS
jgi:hypothetical protein